MCTASNFGPKNQRSWLPTKSNKLFLTARFSSCDSPPSEGSPPIHRQLGMNHDVRRLRPPTTMAQLLADVGRRRVDVAQLCCELCSTTLWKHSGKLLTLRRCEREHQLGRHFADASRHVVGEPVFAKTKSLEAVCRCSFMKSLHLTSECHFCSFPFLTWGVIYLCVCAVSMLCLCCAYAVPLWNNSGARLVLLNCH